MIETKLFRAITRAEKAYSEYLNDKLFYQAQRILKANTVIYSLLEAYLLECEESQMGETIKYLFHLEDWFQQYNESIETKKPELEDTFIFTRLKKSPPYPKNFINSLKKLS